MPAWTNGRSREMNPPETRVRPSPQVPGACVNDIAPPVKESVSPQVDEHEGYFRKAASERINIEKDKQSH